MFFFSIFFDFFLIFFFFFFFFLTLFLDVMAENTHCNNQHSNKNAVDMQDGNEKNCHSYIKRKNPSKHINSKQRNTKAENGRLSVCIVLVYIETESTL